ncbi:MAG TPA: HEAT repeat domain-containing protein, partial [Humisphaera sp.]
AARVPTIAVAQAPAPPPVAPAAPAPDAGPLNPDADNERHVEQMRRTLFEGRTQDERDDAARRLISRQSRAGRDPVHRALADRANPMAQLAAARAVVEDPVPQPQLIGPLRDLLGTTPAATEAAAAALLNYRDDPTAVDRWLAFVGDPARPNRASAVRPARSAAHVRVIQELVRLVAIEDDAAVRDAMFDALNDATGGTTRNGRDPAAWRQWVIATRPPVSRADLLDWQRRRRPPPSPDLDPLLVRLIQAVPEARQPDELKRILASTDPTFRAAGVRVLYQIWTRANGRFVLDPADLRDKIRDAAPEVRLETARLMRLFVVRAAVADVAAQLAADPEPAVRAELCAALGRLADVRTVPQLLALVQADPTMQVKAAAAAALGGMADALQADPQLRGQVIGGLTGTVKLLRGGGDPSGELTAACIDALARFAARAAANPDDAGPLGKLFLSGLASPDGPPPPWRVRQAALGGLAALGDRQNAAAILDLLARREPEPSVRGAALDALAGIGSFNTAAGVYGFSLPPGPPPQTGEPSEDVRRRAWAAFLKLADGATPEELTEWARRVDDPRATSPQEAVDRRVAVLRRKLAKLTDPAAPNPEAAARAREEIGGTLLRRPDRRLADAQQAVLMYREALAYWRANQGAAMTIASLTRSLLAAHLAARQYDAAVALVPQAANADALLADIATEAERLLRVAKEPAAAGQLANLALALPNVPPQFVGRLKDVAAQATPR